MALLKVENLGVTYRRDGHAVPALDGISITLKAGERLAVLGESGSGKSTLGLALGSLLPAGTDVAGAIRWPGFGDRPPRLGKDIGFVFQDPAGSLDPLMRVGDQVAEVLRVHASIGAADAAGRAAALLDQVSLPTGVATAWPHQLSGGQKQRVALACAIAAGPALLVADEATSALDTIVQASILALLRRLVEQGTMALLLITHDIAVAASNADRIAVLQHGRLVEIGSATQIVHAPREPYTRRLVAAHIALDAPPRLAGTRP